MSRRALCGLLACPPADAVCVDEEPQTDGRNHSRVGRGKNPGPKVQPNHHDGHKWQERLDEAPHAREPPRQSNHGRLQGQEACLEASLVMST